MTYEAVGSGAGQTRIINPEPGDSPIEYAGSDSLLPEEKYEENSDLQMIPTLAGQVTFYKLIIELSVFILRIENPSMHLHNITHIGKRRGQHFVFLTSITIDQQVWYFCSKIFVHYCTCR